MRLTDRMIQEQNRNRLQRERETENQQEENQEDETGMIYRPRPRWGYLNDNKGIFDVKDETSINTAPSIFDRTAVFRVSKREDEE